MILFFALSTYMVINVAKKKSSKKLRTVRITGLKCVHDVTLSAYSQLFSSKIIQKTVKHKKKFKGYILVCFFDT